MKRTTRLAATLALAASLILPASVFAAEVVTETVTVPSVVGITLSKNSINYGTVIPGANVSQAEAAATAAERTIAYTVTANAGWHLTVTGSSFTGTPSGSMSDEVRKAKVGAGSYDTVSNLGKTGTAAGFSETAIFLVQPPDGQVPGVYAGTITFTVTTP